MKIFHRLGFVIMIFLLCGCGHTTVRIDRGTGGVFRIPLPNGDSLVELKGGDIDSTTIIMRGGTQVATGRSVGGSIVGGSGGSASDMQISTIPQLNEGYMKDVMISPDVPAEVKIELAKYMAKAKPNTPQPYKTATIGASSGGGGDLSTVKPEATGIDNMVNKVTDVIPEVTSDASHSFIKMASASETWIIVIAITIVLLFSVILFFVLLNKRRIKAYIRKSKHDSSTATK